MKTIKPDPSEPKSPAPNNRWRRLSEAWLALASLFPLLLYAYMGSFMRLSGDDYCYGAYLVRLGFWRAQLESYLRISTYHGDRYLPRPGSNTGTMVSSVCSTASFKSSCFMAVTMGLTNQPLSPNQPLIVDSATGTCSRA